MTALEIDQQTDRTRRLARLDRMAKLLDGRFRVPGLGIRFGYDSILGLIPGVGDLVTAVPSAIIIYEAHRMGVRAPVLAQMGANAAVDFVVGGVPVLGDAFDLFFKSHQRNMALLHKELETQDRRA